MSETGVRVEGLSALTRELRRADKTFQRELGRAYQRIGTPIAAAAEARIKGAAKGRGGYHGTGRYRASASATSGKIEIRGDRNPRALGDEFGALKFRQFASWRGNQWTNWPDAGVGYALHPEIRDRERSILDGFGDAFNDAMRGAYPKGTA